MRSLPGQCSLAVSGDVCVAHGLNSGTYIGSESCLYCVQATHDLIEPCAGRLSCTLLRGVAICLLYPITGAILLYRSITSLGSAF